MAPAPGMHYFRSKEQIMNQNAMRMWAGPLPPGAVEPLPRIVEKKETMTFAGPLPPAPTEVTEEAGTIVRVAPTPVILV